MSVKVLPAGRPEMKRRCRRSERVARFRVTSSECKEVRVAGFREEEIPDTGVMVKQAPIRKRIWMDFIILVG